MADPVDTTARSLAGMGCLLAIVGAACAWSLLALIAVLSWWVVRAFGFDDFFGPVLVFVLAMLVAIPLVGCWALLSGSTFTGRPLVAGGRAAALALLLVGLAIPAGWLFLAGLLLVAQRRRHGCCVPAAAAILLASGPNER